MKFIAVLFSLLFLTNVYSISPTDEKKQENFEIKKSSPFLSYSAEFFITKDDVLNEKVIRTGLLCPRYYYDLFDENNTFQARGVTRFFSLGTFSDNLMDIDIYSKDDILIGSIEGKFIRKSRAKFVFYDNSRKEIAIAYLDSKKPDFLIVDATKQANIIAKITSNTFGEVGILNMEIKPNIKMNAIMLKMFASFISDYNESFLEKPVEIHNHYNDNRQINNYN